MSDVQMVQTMGTGMALFIGLLMLSAFALCGLIALSVRYSARANSVEGGDIYAVLSLCFGYIPAIVYACVKKKLATAPVDTPEKLADQKRSKICLILGIVLHVVLAIAALVIYFGAIFSAVSYSAY